MKDVNTGDKPLGERCASRQICDLLIVCKAYSADA